MTNLKFKSKRANSLAGVSDGSRKRKLFKNLFRSKKKGKKSTSPEESVAGSETAKSVKSSEEAATSKNDGAQESSDSGRKSVRDDDSGANRSSKSTTGSREGTNETTEAKPEGGEGERRSVNKQQETWEVKSREVIEDAPSTQGGTQESVPSTTSTWYNPLATFMASQHEARDAKSREATEDARSQGSKREKRPPATPYWQQHFANYWNGGNKEEPRRGSLGPSSSSSGGRVPGEAHEAGRSGRRQRKTERGAASVPPYPNQPAQLPPFSVPCYCVPLVPPDFFDCNSCPAQCPPRPRRCCSPLASESCSDDPCARRPINRKRAPQQCERPEEDTAVPVVCPYCDCRTPQPPPCFYDPCYSQQGRQCQRQDQIPKCRVRMDCPPSYDRHPARCCCECQTSKRSCSETKSRKSDRERDQHEQDIKIRCRQADSKPAKKGTLKSVKITISTSKKGRKTSECTSVTVPLESVSCPEPIAKGCDRSKSECGRGRACKRDRENTWERDSKCCCSCPPPQCQSRSSAKRRVSEDTQVDPCCRWLPQSPDGESGRRYQRCGGKPTVSCRNDRERPFDFWYSRRMSPSGCASGPSPRGSNLPLDRCKNALKSLWSGISRRQEEDEEPINGQCQSQSQSSVLSSEECDAGAKRSSWCPKSKENRPCDDDTALPHVDVELRFHSDKSSSSDSGTSSCDVNNAGTNFNNKRFEAAIPESTEIPVELFQEARSKKANNADGSLPTQAEGLLRRQNENIGLVKESEVRGISDHSNTDKNAAATLRPFSTSGANRQQDNGSRDRIRTDTSSCYPGKKPWDKTEPPASDKLLEPHSFDEDNSQSRSGRMDKPFINFENGFFKSASGRCVKNTRESKPKTSEVQKATWSFELPFKLPMDNIKHDRPIIQAQPSSTYTRLTRSSTFTRTANGDKFLASANESGNKNMSDSEAYWDICRRIDGTCKGSCSSTDNEETSGSFEATSLSGGSVRGAGEAKALYYQAAMNVQGEPVDSGDECEAAEGDQDWYFESDLTSPCDCGTIELTTCNQKETENPACEDSCTTLKEEKVCSRQYCHPGHRYTCKDECSKSPKADLDCDDSAAKQCRDVISDCKESCASTTKGKPTCKEAASAEKVSSSQYCHPGYSFSRANKVEKSPKVECPCGKSAATNEVKSTCKKTTTADKIRSRQNCYPAYSFARVNEDERPPKVESPCGKTAATNEVKSTCKETATGQEVDKVNGRQYCHPDYNFTRIDKHEKQDRAEWPCGKSAATNKEAKSACDETATKRQVGRMSSQHHCSPGYSCTLINKNETPPTRESACCKSTTTQKVPACGKSTTTYTRKADPVCCESTTTCITRVDPSCCESITTCTREVDPVSGKCTTTCTKKVNPACGESTTTCTKKVDPTCGECTTTCTNKVNPACCESITTCTKEVDPACCESTTTCIRKENPVCGKCTSTCTQKVDPACCESTTTCTKKVDPVCCDCTTICTKEVDPACCESTTTCTKKVDPVCCDCTTVCTKKVDPACCESTTTCTKEVNPACGECAITCTKKINPACDECITTCTRKVDPVCGECTTACTKKVDPACCESTNTCIRKLDPVCGKCTTTCARKEDPACCESTTTCTKKVDPVCGECTTTCTKKVDPVCGESATMCTRKVDPACGKIITTYTQKVDPVCRERTNKQKEQKVTDRQHCHPGYRFKSTNDQEIENCISRSVSECASDCKSCDTCHSEARQSRNCQSSISLPDHSVSIRNSLQYPCPGSVCVSSSVTIVGVPSSRPRDVRAKDVTRLDSGCNIGKQDSVSRSQSLPSQQSNACRIRTKHRRRHSPENSRSSTFCHSDTSQEQVVRDELSRDMQIFDGDYEWRYPARNSGRRSCSPKLRGENGTTSDGSNSKRLICEGYVREVKKIFEGERDLDQLTDRLSEPTADAHCEIPVAWSIEPGCQINADEKTTCRPLYAKIPRKRSCQDQTRGKEPKGKTCGHRAKSRSESRCRKEKKEHQTLSCCSLGCSTANAKLPYKTYDACIHRGQNFANGEGKGFKMKRPAVPCAYQSKSDLACGQLMPGGQRSVTCRKPACPSKEDCVSKWERQNCEGWIYCPGSRSEEDCSNEANASSEDENRVNVWSACLSEAATWLQSRGYIQVREEKEAKSPCAGNRAKGPCKVTPIRTGECSMSSSAEENVCVDEKKSTSQCWDIRKTKNECSKKRNLINTCDETRDSMVDVRETNKFDGECKKGENVETPCRADQERANYCENEKMGCCKPRDLGKACATKATRRRCFDERRMRNGHGTNEDNENSYCVSKRDNASRCGTSQWRSSCENDKHGKADYGNEFPCAAQQEESCTSLCGTDRLGDKCCIKAHAGNSDSEISEEGNRKTPNPCCRGRGKGTKKRSVKRDVTGPCVSVSGDECGCGCVQTKDGCCKRRKRGVIQSALRREGTYCCETDQTNDLCCKEQRMDIPCATEKEKRCSCKMCRRKDPCLSKGEKSFICGELKHKNPCAVKGDNICPCENCRDRGPPLVKEENDVRCENGRVRDTFTPRRQSKFCIDSGKVKDPCVSHSGDAMCCDAGKMKDPCRGKKPSASCCENGNTEDSCAAKRGHWYWCEIGSSKGGCPTKRGSVFTCVQGRDVGIRKSTNGSWCDEAGTDAVPCDAKGGNACCCATEKPRRLCCTKSDCNLSCCVEWKNSCLYETDKTIDKSCKNRDCSLPCCIERKDVCCWETGKTKDSCCEKRKCGAPFCVELENSGCCETGNTKDRCCMKRDNNLMCCAEQRKSCCCETGNTNKTCCMNMDNNLLCCVERENSCCCETRNTKDKCCVNRDNNLRCCVEHGKSCCCATGNTKDKCCRNRNKNHLCCVEQGKSCCCETGYTNGKCCMKRDINPPCCVKRVSSYSFETGDTREKCCRKRNTNHRRCAERENSCCCDNVNTVRKCCLCASKLVNKPCCDPSGNRDQGNKSMCCNGQVCVCSCAPRESACCGCKSIYICRACEGDLKRRNPLCWNSMEEGNCGHCCSLNVWEPAGATLHCAGTLNGASLKPTKSVGTICMESVGGCGKLVCCAIQTDPCTPTPKPCPRTKDSCRGQLPRNFQAQRQLIMKYENYVFSHSVDLLKAERSLFSLGSKNPFRPSVCRAIPSSPRCSKYGALYGPSTYLRSPCSNSHFDIRNDRYRNQGTDDTTKASPMGGLYPKDAKIWKPGYKPLTSLDSSGESLDDDDSHSQSSPPSTSREAFPASASARPGTRPTLQLQGQRLFDAVSQNRQSQRQKLMTISRKWSKHKMLYYVKSYIKNLRSNSEDCQNAPVSVS